MDGARVRNRESLTLQNLGRGRIAVENGDAGPGKLCRTFKIDVTLNGTALQLGQALWLEHRDRQFQQQLDAGNLTLTQTTRIGLTKGVDLPRRWYLSHSPAVSKY